jgi:tetratricopeptide (TPR) repeat protein
MRKYIFLPAVCLLLVSTTPAQTGKTAIQYYDQGIKLLDTEKYTEALAAFKNAIAKDPGYKEALYSAGWTCNELKNYTDAVAYLEKARTLWPNEAKVYLELGYANEMLKKKTVAIDFYNKCLSLDDEYALAYKYLGLLYYDDFNNEKAIENFEYYLELVPDTEDDNVYYKKGVAENDLARYNAALASVKKAVELKPRSTRNINELAYTYYLLENADDALNNYDRALLIDPKSLSALNGRADVYRKLKKDAAAAIKLYAKTLELEPKNKKANYWTGWCYNEMERYNDAVPFLKKVIEVDDQYVSAYTELGYSDYALKNYDDALYYFKKAFAIEKTALNLYYTGLCYVGKKQKAEAAKMVLELKAMKSDYAGKLQEKIDKL